MKILVIALSGIGDALMFSPAIAAIKEAMPEAEIDVLCMFKGVKEIYEINPKISGVIYFNFMKEGFIKSLFFLLKIRNKYDATFNVYPSNRKEYNVISFLIGAKERYAVSYLRMNRVNFGFLNNQTLIENDYLHNVEENLLLVKLFLANHNILSEDKDLKLEIYLDASAIQFADEWLEKNLIKRNDIVIGFHAGCATLKNHIKRRWEPEKFIQLAKFLIQNYGAKVLLFGGPDEYELNDYIKSMVDSENIKLVKTETLLQTSAVMKRCNLFITNDSALMHVASALQLNVVALFGPTNPVYVHPYKTNYKIASLNLECQPCFIYSPKSLICRRNDVKFKCIKELTVDKVKEVVIQFLNELNLIKNIQ